MRDHRFMKSFSGILSVQDVGCRERGSVLCAWLFQAEEFRDTVHMLLEWLSEAEQTLRFRGALPDDAEALQSLIDTHKVTSAPRVPPR